MPAVSFDRPWLCTTNAGSLHGGQEETEKLRSTFSRALILMLRLGALFRPKSPTPGGGSGSDGRGHRLPLTPDPSTFSSHHPAFLDRRCFRSEARPATIPATLFQGTSSAFKLARRLSWVLLTNRGRQSVQVRRDTLSVKSGASQEVKGCSRAAKGR